MGCSKQERALMNGITLTESTFSECGMPFQEVVIGAHRALASGSPLSNAKRSNHSLISALLACRLVCYHIDDGNVLKNMAAHGSANLS
eukprot:scaffold263988_cov20-Prasinocladus_malaysianus.AAC.1